MKRPTLEYAENCTLIHTYARKIEEYCDYLEKAREDYNLSELYICEMNESDYKFVFKVNNRITIEFRNNYIVNKLKKKKYKYALDVSYENFGDGMFKLDVKTWMPLPKPYKEKENES